MTRSELTHQSAALAIYHKIESPIEAAKILGKEIALSKMIGVPSVEAGTVVALTCMAEGITPLEFQRTYHIIQGRPSKKAHTMLVEFRARGGEYDMIKYDYDEVRYKFTYLGKEMEFGLTWEECKQSRWPWKDWQDHSEGLKDNWATPMDQRRMMFARMVSEAMSIMCPEINYGLSTPEEVSDVIDGVVLDTIETPQLPAPKAKEAKPVVQAEAPEEAVPATAELVPFDTLEAEAPKEDSGVNDVVVARIEQLIQQAGLTEQQAGNITASRNVSSLYDLSPQQSQEVIDKLQRVVAAKK